MPYEIDFLPVGNGDKSGDAIAVRYGTPGKYTVMVYDGGTKESGAKLVEHIKKYYKTDYVDHVVSSHPDADHASGLSVVLEELEVGTLWLHRPWKYSNIILDYFKDNRITSASLKARLQEKMSSAYQLEALALQKRITIKEPFQGEAIGQFYVLSPDKDWYIHELIAEFQKSPEQITAEAALSPAGSLLKLCADALQEGITWVADKLEIEHLREDVSTSAENESSVILYAYIEDPGDGVLLTGDAGIMALEKAAEYLETNGVSAPAHVKFVQVPHHGSRHNVSGPVLDRMLGKRGHEIPSKFEKYAFISASKNSTSHPKKVVTNAFYKRGYKPYATQGGTKHHHRGMPDRGWSSATPIEYSDKVESWD